ncbi:MAG: four helix bundle protein [Waterburya sp.]
MRNFRDLQVWEKAHQLTISIYKTTSNFPKEELYGLTSQIRRACASIPANIAEGCGRGSEAELARFLQISMGSASELEYHLLLVRDLRIIQSEEYQLLLDKLIEVKKMLASLILKIKA